MPAKKIETDGYSVDFKLGIPSILAIPRGESRIVNGDKEIAFTSVADRTICEIDQFSYSSICIKCLSPGYTTVTLWFQANVPPEEISIVVSPNDLPSDAAIALRKQLIINTIPPAMLERFDIIPERIASLIQLSGTITFSQTIQLHHLLFLDGFVAENRTLPQVHVDFGIRAGQDEDLLPGTSSEWLRLENDMDTIAANLGSSITDMTPIASSEGLSILVKVPLDQGAGFDVVSERIRNYWSPFYTPLRFLKYFLELSFVPT